jgi:coenzyme F420-dependent glucose-6-phosphate dehydrogenase
MSNWERGVEIGYTASLEQFQPDVALEHAVLAEKVGFEAVWASDHFLPWYHTDASCGFAWSWLGAVGHATQKTKLGTGLTCPIFRYHPALVAQAFATLNYMFGSRIFLALGSGEALNEVPLGYDWPRFTTRAKRLEEAIGIIRKLFTGELVNFKGRYYRLRRAKLYTPPKGRIPIFVAASGPTVAEIAGRLADGFLTLPASEEHYTRVLFPALEKGARSAQRNTDDVEKAIEVWMSYDEDYDKALKSVKPWAGSLLPVFFKLGVYDPKEIEEHGNLVGDKQLAEAWTIATSSEPMIKTVEKFVKLGFGNIHITSSSPDQRKFIQFFGKKALPYLKEEFRTK